MSRKPKEPITAEDRLEMELQLEADLGRLMRQHRVLERDRSTYSTAKLAKQKRVIDILKKENKNILTDLNVATCSTRVKQDSDVESNLCSLIREHDSFHNTIAEKKAHLRELDLQIEMTRKDVVDLQGKQVTDIKYMARVLQGQKTVEALENKLDCITKRFCTIMSKNRKMREEIDHLLLERVYFNKIWDKLIKNLNKGKSFMMDLIEQSTIAYDQREEWCTKLQALRIRAHGDLNIHTQDMQELQRKLDHDGKLELFLAVKGQKRIMKDLEEQEIKKREDKRETMQKQLEMYKEMLAEILEASGVEDIDSFSRKFVKQEEGNFGVLNYINMLNKDLEDMTAELVETYKNIDEEREINSNRILKQATTLDKLRNDVKLATEKVDTVEATINSTDEKLKQLYTGVEKLFGILKCNNAPFLVLLGDNTRINEYNVLLYLKMLEGRISELIVNVYYKQKSSTAKKTKAEPKDVIKEPFKSLPVAAITDLVPTSPCPLCVELENVQDVIDTLQFVHSKDQIKSILEQRLMLPDGLKRLHNVSACNLPKSRQIIQRRYQ